MLKKHTRALFVLSSALFCFFLLPLCPAEALLKKSKIKKNSPQTDVAQSYPYRVFFIIEPVSGSTSSKKWLEINYKLVNGSEVPGPIFPGTSGGKVRFLDKDGFVLAADFFLIEDFQKADFYSSLLVEKKRAGAIVSADVQPLREGELESLRRERAEKTEQREREDELYQMAVGRTSAPASPEPEKSTQPASSPVPAPAESAAVQPGAPAPSILLPAVSPEVSAAPSSVPEPKIPAPAPSQAASGAPDSPQQALEVPSVTQKQVTASPQPVKIPPSSSDKKKDKDLLDLGGTTNDQIQDTLSELTKKPGTEIKESPSQIPGVSSEEPTIDTVEQQQT